MPKRRDSRDVTKLTDRQELWLREGSLFGERFPFASTDASAEAWEEHGDEITEEYIENKPGHRPEGWWRFTAPEGRERYKPFAVVGDPPDHLQGLGLEAANLADLGELQPSEYRQLTDEGDNPA